MQNKKDLKLLGVLFTLVFIILNLQGCSKPNIPKESSSSTTISPFYYSSEYINSPIREQLNLNIGYYFYLIAGEQDLLEITYATASYTEDIIALEEAPNDLDDCFNYIDYQNTDREPLTLYVEMQWWDKEYREFQKLLVDIQKTDYIHDGNIVRIVFYEEGTLREFYTTEITSDDTFEDETVERMHDEMWKKYLNDLHHT